MVMLPRDESKAVRQVGRAIACIVLAAAAFALAGCTVQDAGPQTARTGPLTGTQPTQATGSQTGPGTDTATTTPAGESGCRGAGFGEPPRATVTVRDAQGNPRANVTVQAMLEWDEYATAMTNASGCTSFAFAGKGEYQFATVGGSCEEQATQTMVWDGSAPIDMALTMQSVCQV